MRVRRAIAALSVAALVAGGGCARNGAMQGVIPIQQPALRGRATETVIPCSQLETLRQLHLRLKVYKNPSTGDSLEYFVVGDGALSKDVLAMFPGTGQTIADWPAQLITNSQYSPKIVHSVGYQKSEDGPVSLCHNYRLVFFDYPGVGETPSQPNVNKDDDANDVDALLGHVAATTGIHTDRVDPVGWSLGSTNALKYAFLSPVSRPSRTIGNVILMAVGPGGNTDGTPSNNSGACVSTLFAESLYYGSSSVEKQITTDLSELIFPFEGQTRSENGSNSTCTAKVDSSGVTLSVTPECTELNLCKAYIEEAVLSDETPPWKTTGGIGQQVYLEEREQSNDWYTNYCRHAGAGFTSLDCVTSGKVEMSATNGGVCKTDTSNANKPVATECAQFHVSGRILAITGYEDLYDQWTYARALVEGLNRSNGSGTALWAVYPGSAGHGSLIQHPKWMQAQINTGVSFRKP